MNPLLAENYARYGSLLLRVAIKNNDQNVLSSTNAATAGTAETTEALLQAASGNKKRVIEFSGDGDEENEEESPEEQQDQEDDQSGEPEAENADEEEDDFTIAWENLDVARLLFEKRIESCNDESEKLALNRALGYVYQDLGDLSLENGTNYIMFLFTYNSLFLENFPDSICEYELALKRFGTATTEILRDLAGIYFNLALSMEFENRLAESKEMYTRAKELLQQKEAYILSNETETSIDEKANECEPVSNPELNELKGLISEISLKIEDMDNSNQTAMSQELQNATNKAALAAAQNLNGAVNDLSGMIKKRKAEPVEAAPSQKEVKIEEESKESSEVTEETN